MCREQSTLLMVTNGYNGINPLCCFEMTNSAESRAFLLMGISNIIRHLN